MRAHTPGRARIRSVSHRRIRPASPPTLALCSPHARSASPPPSRGISVKRAGHRLVDGGQVGVRLREQELRGPYVPVVFACLCVRACVRASALARACVQWCVCARRAGVRACTSQTRATSAVPDSDSKRGPHPRAPRRGRQPGPRRARRSWMAGEEPSRARAADLPRPKPGRTPADAAVSGWVTHARLRAHTHT